MKYKFNEKQIEEIKKARKKNKDKKIDKRLEVLELRCDGKKLQEIVDITGFHRSHISNLLKMYFESGLPAIAEKHYGGNRRNMSYEEESAFLEQYEEQSKKGNMVSVGEMAAAYEKAVGHPIGSGQIYRVLHRHGWRKVMPRSKHPKKATEEVIETSKKLTKESTN